MHEELRKFVSSFQLLTDEEVSIIVDNACIKSFKKGEVLLREGQVAKECMMCEKL